MKKSLLILLSVISLALPIRDIFGIELRPLKNIRTPAREYEIKKKIKEAASKYMDGKYACFGIFDLNKTDTKIYFTFSDIEQKDNEEIKAQVKVNNAGTITAYFDNSLLEKNYKNLNEIDARLSSTFVHELSHIYDIINDPKSPYFELREEYLKFNSQLLNSNRKQRDSLLINYNEKSKILNEKMNEYLEEEKLNQRSERRAHLNEWRFLEESTIRKTAPETYKEIKKEITDYLKTNK